MVRSRCRLEYALIFHEFSKEMNSKSYFSKFGCQTVPRKIPILQPYLENQVGQESLRMFTMLWTFAC